MTTGDVYRVLLQVGPLAFTLLGGAFAWWRFFHGPAQLRRDVELAKLLGEVKIDDLEMEDLHARIRKETARLYSYTGMPERFRRSQRNYLISGLLITALAVPSILKEPNRPLSYINVLTLALIVGGWLFSRSRVKLVEEELKHRKQYRAAVSVRDVASARQREQVSRLRVLHQPATGPPGGAK